ncbi:MAG TPA: TonB-dependent receptor, partial [Longimicrobiales bacterium]
MLPESLRRLAVPAVGATVLALVTSTSALAQASTGKIQGRVVDASTGQPIAAAQVEVVGTNRGNITNDDGYYFINDVPAGLMDIRAVSIGYQEVVVDDQRILAGQTHTQNFSLAPTAVEIEAIVIEGEANPLVPRDQVSSRAIVTGETIDQLPLDNAESIVALQPGVITTNDGLTIRGSRPNEEATYVDGVLVRRFQTGDASPLELPTNALAQVDVTTGGFSARYSDAQSGIVNYTTRTGNEFGGSISYMTDMIAPSDWQTGFHRAEASVGGPVFGALSFFVAGTAEGGAYSTLACAAVGPCGTIPQGTDLYVISGVDTTFMVASTEAETGLTDSVAVAFPSFELWENEGQHPYNQSDEYNLVTRLNYGLGGGSNLSASYYRNRDQVLHRNAFYNPQTTEGTYTTADVVTLGGYFILLQSADQAVALDVKASYQNFWTQFGHVDANWLLDHSDPALNFNFSSIDFMVDPDDFPLTDDVYYGLRSRVLTEDSLFTLYPGREDLATKQTYAGLPVNLRMNPYALYTGFSIAGYEAQIGGLGIGGLAGEWREEQDWVFSGSVDWQAGRYNRIFVGGDYADISMERMQVGLFEGPIAPYRNDPTRAGFFVQDRLDLGDVVLEAGVRYDYFQPGGSFPRIPGFVTSVPDSLRADAFELTPLSEAPEGATELERVRRVIDCGGAATEARRTRADGTVVCKNNFIEAETKTAWSPRLAVSFPVTATSTFRLSYGQNVQVPALQASGGFEGGIGTASGQAGMFSGVYADLDGGIANTNSQFGRDVDLPRTTLFEAGYRRLFGESLVFDIAAYAKTTRNGLSYRTLPFISPATGRTENINVLTNADYALTRGVDVRVDKRFGEYLDVTGSYSFVDARGTGSDPASYVDIIKRGSSVLSLRTGQPIAPPEAMLPLDQSRAHNFSGTFS